jgi:hypothetical protein
VIASAALKPAAVPPPSVPPRNGSRLEHSSSSTAVVATTAPRLQEKYFDTNIEASPSSSSTTTAAALKKISAGVVNGGSNCDKAAFVTSGGGGSEAALGGRDVADRAGPGSRDGGNNYRDSWKARQDQQNTLVFNFINSKKDVSHIENDGLDLTKRQGNAVASNKVKKRVFWGPPSHSPRSFFPPQ